MTESPDTLPFKVASHILEDLGLTLYTSLARVLVEFVANAYDADATCASIRYDPVAIEEERSAMRTEYNAEFQRAVNKSDVTPLTARSLPESLDIIVEDDGHGMNRADMAAKFLVAGRRRLEEEPEAEGRSMEKKRPLMGRKGLGKLAGFGVARLIEATSRVSGEDHATKVVLDFDEIMKESFTDEIAVPTFTIPGGGGLPASGGTRIRLSRLMHSPTKNRPETIVTELSDHFQFIEVDDFGIMFNERVIEPVSPEHAFGWPEPERALPEFAEKTVQIDEDGSSYQFKYRLRFTADRQALRASRRGVRVYTHGRLCAAPSLLDADTNMHGFRMTDYLDGVVHADFIAEQKEDYIATDRQGLRWESPLLQPMYTFLSSEIKEACKQYQEHRDSASTSVVQDDDFTTSAIDDAGLSDRDKRMAFKIAALLYQATKSVESQEYRDKLPILIEGVGHGTILTAITEVAGESQPDLELLTIETTRLTHDEIGRFMSTVKGRVRAIEGFRKIVQATDFGAKQNERTIQEMFMESPWLINPTYSQFLSADKTKRTLFELLAKHLKINDYAAKPLDNDDERPDLVFLLGNMALQRLVIVELKSANTPLTGEHVAQLERYMSDADEWLEGQQRSMDVRGILIGNLPSRSSNAKGAKDLRNRVKNQTGERWVVRTYLNVLEETEAAHRELLEIYGRDDGASA